MIENTLLKRARAAIVVILLVCLPIFAFAEEGGITHEMTYLVIQLGLIIILAYIGGRLAVKIGLPSVLGELAAGILLSQGALGGIALPGFPAGLFPPSASFAVSSELYGFATLASIILLFMSGLETDISLFKRYAATGGVVGLGGVVVSFGLGALCGVVAFGWAWMDPRTLFLGILGTATSVGITARIISDQRKMDSPEGVTILAAAVLDDVLGIVCLAVVLGISAVKGQGATDWGRIAGIAAKALGIWATFTILGLVFSKRIARFLKVFRTPEAFSILALGLALLLSGFFETEGLAMIIGAYIMGLSLSGTDLKLVIREKLQPLYMFLVPIFFAVMGMLVDLRELADPKVLAFGAVYTLVGFASKIIGCGLPTFAFGFNLLGALRVGVGMVPRGEVALIIAGIGISGGFLDKKLFGVVIMMTLLTTVIPPPLLKALLRRPGSGTKSKPVQEPSSILEIPVGDPNLTEVVLESMATQLKNEGFYVRFLDPESDIYIAAREDSRISLRPEGEGIVIECAPCDASLARAIAHETLVSLADSFKRATEGIDPESLKRGILGACSGTTSGEASELVSRDRVILNLGAKTKEEAARELVELLAKKGDLSDIELAVADIAERERIGSTGLERGIAFPHGRTDAVKHPVAAVGLSAAGVDFGAADGLPARVIVLLLSPKSSEEPHLRLMAGIASVLSDEFYLDEILTAHSADDVAQVFSRKKKR